MTRTSHSPTPSRPTPDGGPPDDVRSQVEVPEPPATGPADVLEGDRGGSTSHSQADAPPTGVDYYWTGTRAHLRGPTRKGWQDRRWSSTLKVAKEPSWFSARRTAQAVGRELTRTIWVKNQGPETAGFRRHDRSERTPSPRDGGWRQRGLAALEASLRFLGLFARGGDSCVPGRSAGECASLCAT